MSSGVNGARQRTIVLVMWGDLFEDFFDSIDVSIHDFQTSLTGGWLFNYAQALQRAGIRAVLLHVSARVDGVMRFVHEPTGTPVTILPAPRRLRVLRAIGDRLPYRRAARSIVSWLSMPVRSLIDELRYQGAEAILTQEYEHARFDVLVGVGRFTGLPVFASFQGGDHPNSRLERFFRGTMVRASAGLIIAAEVERQRVRRTYRVPPKKIADIPNPVDVAAYRPRDRVEARGLLGIPSDAVVVAWHGRVSIKPKGLDLLLEAWAQVCRQRPSVNLLLLMVGTGQDASELHRRLDAFEYPTVQWHDEYITDRSVLLRYTSAADIYVLPSRHEGFPVAPLEAMAGSLPVVAAAASGIPDILSAGEEHGGIVVPLEDTDALARALGALIDDPDRRARLGVNARRRVEEQYSYEAVGERLRALLLCDGPPPLAHERPSPRRG